MYCFTYKDTLYTIPGFWLRALKNTEVSRMHTKYLEVPQELKFPLDLISLYSLLLIHYHPEFNKGTEQETPSLALGRNKPLIIGSYL